MRSRLTYLLLLAIKSLSRLFFKHETGWVGEVPDDPWAGLRLVAILHHTSLYEPLFAAHAPNRFMRQVAERAIVPVADKTLKRPFVGAFFRLVAGNVVPITRQRDDTWRQVVEQAAADSLIIILPEGRMMRRTGLDSEGRPMTVRGGIADLLKATPSGRLLIAYSGGLHHIQAPGDRLPRPFKTVRMNFEVLDIASYRHELLERGGEQGFRRAVKADLEARRDRYCPTRPELLGATWEEVVAGRSNAA